MNKQEKQIDIYRSEYILNLETELEELKRDVKYGLIDFIHNVFIECDEYGLEPTIPSHETGLDIVKRWRSRLKELENKLLKVGEKEWKK